MSKYTGHIQSILPGTGGYGTGTNSLRLNTFDVGAGWREYGQTTNTNYWSVVDPTSSGAHPNTLVGPVVYQYKAAQGPSIVSFSPVGNTGSNSPFMLYSRAISGQTAGQMGTYGRAVAWYLGNTGATVVTNEFKSLPKIEDVIFAFDADQAMSVPPATGSVTQVALISKDISQYGNSIQQTTFGATRVRYRGFGQSVQQPLPWHIDWSHLASANAQFYTPTSGPLFSSDKMTINIWLKITADNNFYEIFTYSGEATSLAQIQVLHDGGTNQIQIAYQNMDTGVVNTLNVSYTSGSWVNLTIVRNSANITVYQNSVQVASASNFGIGSFGGGGQMFVGDNTAQGVGLLFNSVYMWKDDLSIYTAPGTPYNGVEFFYQGSKASFGI